MIFRLTTVHENAGSAGILPAVAGHRALDDVAGKMPALPFSSQRRVCAVDFVGKIRRCFAALSMTVCALHSG
jgi:hypothetical protein